MHKRRIATRFPNINILRLRKKGLLPGERTHSIRAMTEVAGVERLAKYACNRPRESLNFKT